jgi:pantetheine-phosphate adenylyltransferase
MKIAVYPGSFNPFHDGHVDILRKALKLFDKVIVACGINPAKDYYCGPLDELNTYFAKEIKCGKVEVQKFNGLLVDYVNECEADAIVRGLRNGNDLLYEQSQQYWNEDLGLTIPIVYFVCDRKLSHISSSAIRAIDKAKDVSSRR